MSLIVSVVGIGERVTGWEGGETREAGARASRGERARERDEKKNEPLSPPLAPLALLSSPLFPLPRRSPASRSRSTSSSAATSPRPATLGSASPSTSTWASSTTRRPAFTVRERRERGGEERGESRAARAGRGGGAPLQPRPPPPARPSAPDFTDYMAARPRGGRAPSRAPLLQPAPVYEPGATPKPHIATILLPACQSSRTRPVGTPQSAGAAPGRAGEQNHTPREREKNPHSPPPKKNPLFFSPGMDFYVVLTRPGYRVAKRRSRQARIGVQHRIGREDAIKWFQAKFDGVVLNKAS